MFALVLAAAVAATPQREPLAIAAPDLSVVNLDENRATFYTEYFAQELTRAGLRVVTAKQISAVLGMERQRQLLNCSDSSSSCMAELANALGTDGILIGTIAQIGSLFQVNLSIVGSRDGATLSVRSLRVNKEEELLDGLAKAAPLMVRDVVGALRPDELKAAPDLEANGQPVAAVEDVDGVATTVEPERPHALRRWSWAPAAGAVALGIGGGVLWAASGANFQKLTAPPGGTIPMGDAQRAVQEGELQQSLAVGAFVAGGVALAAGGTMFFLPTSEASASSAPAVGLSFSSEGGAVVLTGSWP